MSVLLPIIVNYIYQFARRIATDSRAEWVDIVIVTVRYPPPPGNFLNSVKIELGGSATLLQELQGFAQLGAQPTELSRQGNWVRYEIPPAPRRIRIYAPSPANNQESRSNELVQICLFNTFPMLSTHKWPALTEWHFDVDFI